MKRAVAVLFFVIIILVGMIIFRRPDQAERMEGSSYSYEDLFDQPQSLGDETPIDASHFLDRPRFDAALDRLETKCPQPMRGAVVNHHVLASDIIADTVGKLAACLPKNGTMIILSPDHFLVSDTPVALGSRPYVFDGHTIGIDQTALQTLAKLPFAHIQPDLFQGEHGIGALIPFLVQVRPDIKIVPLALRRSIQDTDLASLVDVLKSESASGTFLLVSSDMSHYLSETQALANDDKTLDAFSKNDSEFFETATDDNTDNGRSIAAVIHALENPKWTLLDHSISSKYESSPLYTTSYITGFWK